MGKNYSVHEGLVCKSDLGIDKAAQEEYGSKPGGRQLRYTNSQDHGRRNKGHEQPDRQDWAQGNREV